MALELFQPLTLAILTLSSFYLFSMAARIPIANPHLEQELVYNPVSRYANLYRQYTVSGIRARLPPDLFIRSPCRGGDVLYAVGNVSRRPNPGTVLLVGYRLGLLSPTLSVSAATRDRFVAFFAETTGYYVPDLKMIPGYGVPRPWPEFVVEQMSDRKFYDWMAECNNDIGSLVRRVDYGDTVERCGALIQFLY